MFPEGFIQRIKKQHYIDADGLLHALEIPSPVSIRINRAKQLIDPVHEAPVPWCSDGFYLEKRPSYTLDPLFHSGSYYSQEASGMFLEQVFNQVIINTNGIRVLDLCGAPGGKSTHLSSLIGENGLLVANEVIRSRAQVLAENLTKWGLSNSVVTQNDPSVFGRLPNFFDLILVDAPCSGEGMFRDKVAVNEWSENNGALCSDRQKRILMNAWPALKENGILIYSTCTFNPGENEENLKWLISKHEAETIRLNILEYNGITEIDYHGIFGYGFYPGKIKGEGLFISALKKTGKQDSASGRNKFDTGSKILKDEKSVVCEWTDFSGDNLIRSGDSIIYFPGRYEDYNILSQHLRMISSGTQILIVKNKKYIPSHELAMSVFIKKQAFPAVNLNLAQTIAYLRRESIAVNSTEKGWNIVTYDGKYLGFVNNVGNRLNNYYPVGWRIRMNATHKNDENPIQWNRVGHIFSR